MLNFARRLSLATALILSMSALADAKPTTVGKITDDIPDGFTMSAIARGAQVSSPKGDVTVWFEIYKDAEGDAVSDEHAKYLSDTGIAPNGDPDVKTFKAGDNDVMTLYYPKATLNGKQGVLRYVKLGPVGPDNKFVLMMIVASAEGIHAYGKDVEHMLDSMEVDLKP